MSSGARQYYLKSYTDQQQQDGLVSLYLKGKNRTVQILLTSLGTVYKNKQKPSSSNLIHQGYTKTAGPHFIRNGNRNSLNLWIRGISLSCLPWYWLCVQRPFTLCWLGLNCCGFGSILNAEPTWSFQGLTELEKKQMGL